MGPNGRVMLLDTQEPVMYVKTTDAVGRASILIYDLVERKPAEAETTDPIDYEKIRSMIVEEVKKAMPSKKAKKEED